MIRGFMILLVLASIVGRGVAAAAAAADPVLAKIHAAELLAVQNRDGEAVDAYLAVLADNSGAEYVLRQFDKLSRTTGEIERICGTIGAITFSDPCVAGLATRERAYLLWQMGRVDDAVKLAHTLSPVTNWHICGGFENGERTGLLKEFGPESDPGLSRDYEGKEWRVTWRPAVPTTRMGAVDLGLVRPGRWVTAYLRTGIIVPQATKVMLHMDFPGAFRVWVNSVPAAESSEYIMGTYEMYRVPMDLNAGTNFVLVKLCAEDNGARMFAHIATPEGAPLALHCMQPADDSVPMISQQTNQWPRALLSPHVEKLRSTWEDGKEDMETGIALARHYSAAHRSEDAARVFERVKNARTLDAADLFAMADAYASKDSQSEAVALFRAALAADTNANAARVAIAGHYMQRSMYELAQPLLQEAMGIRSNDLSARLALAELYGDRNWDEDAFQLAEETAKLFGECIESHLALARIALSRDHDERAEAEARHALACNPASGSARQLLIGMYDAQRKYDKLEAEAAIVESLDPTDITPAMTRSGIAHAMRDPVRGIAVCRKALAQFPDHQTFHRLLGDFLYMQRDKQGAIEAYQKSLVYQPDNLHLRRYLDFLKGKSHLFFEQNSLDDAAVKRMINASRMMANIDREAITDTLLQQDIVQLYEDGSSRRQYHSLVKVVKTRGVQVASSMSVPSSDVTKAVTHKKDGTVVEASHVRGGQIEFADVEIGDVIECKYLEDRYGGSWLEENYYNIEGFERQQSPVRRGEFILSVPTNRTLVSMVSSPSIKAEVTPMQGSTVYRWQVKDVAMYQSEPSSPPYLDIGKFVAVSTITNWDMIAQWQHAMMSDVSKGDLSVKKLAEKITQGATSDAQKVALVFRHVTENFRYTQMYESRIAGVKPHPVPNIMANRCGDCKDLSLLTSELLKSVGIKAQLALIRTRSMGVVITNVPSPDVFNHIVVYLPEIGSNGWFVDATFRSGEADLLPNMCQDVRALVISGPVHRFVHTPISPPTDSVTEFNLSGSVDTDGSLTGTLEFVAYKNDASDLRIALERIDSFDKVGQYILAKIDPAGRVKKFDIENKEPTNAPVIMRLSFVAPTFAKQTEGGLSAKLPMPFDTQEMLGGLETRTHPVRLQNLQCERRNYTIALPEGRPWDMSVTNMHLSSKFGTFDFVAEGMEDGIQVAWNLVITQLQISTNEYPAFRDFMAEVADTTTQVLTVKKKK